MRYKIAIIGLGLIGGSLAYALRGFRDCEIAGYDIDADVTRLARERGAIDAACVSAEAAVTDADVCVFASSPRTIVENIGKCMPHMKDGAVVTEISGVKHEIAVYIAANLDPRLRYAGLHPMAGRETGGFVNADANLFKGAGFIVVPSVPRDENAVALIRELSLYAGAGRVVENTADEHDGLIAYTSHLMHIAATALVRDYPQNVTAAHTAGAFRDCTRIARIDADLWAELLSGNAEFIAPHLDALIDNLTAFRDALSSGDGESVRGFLQAARVNKERIFTL